MVCEDDLLASSNLILDGIVASLPDLWLEILVHKLYSSSVIIRVSINRNRDSYLSFLRGPLPIRIPVVHQLIASRVTDLDGGVRNRTLGVPLNVIAGGFGDEEGLGAALVTVFVDAFLDGEVED